MQPDMPVRREVLAWKILSEDLVGTVHQRAADSGQTGASPCLLLLNSAAAPRAGISDLSVQIADRLAVHGFLVFRFDLPGLGDSSGAIPPTLLEYWSDVLKGRNDAATIALVNEIRQQYNPTDVFVGGLSSGVIPAVRAADWCDPPLAGLLLLEPTFTFHHGTSASESASVMVLGTSIGFRRRLRKVLSLRSWLVWMTGYGRLAMALRPVRPLLIRALRRCSWQDTPAELDMATVGQWCRAISRGTQTLLVVAEDSPSDRYARHALASMPNERFGLIAVIRVPGTNHVLSGTKARGTVLDAVEAWALEHFAKRPAKRTDHLGDVVALGQTRNGVAA